MKTNLLTADRPAAARDVRVEGAMRFERVSHAGDGSNIYPIADRKGRHTNPLPWRRAGGMER